MSTTFAEPAVQSPAATPPTAVTDRLEIVVTREDIQAGVRGCPDACPVARSLLRSGYWRASVSDFAVRVLSAHGCGRYLLTDELADWIERFDDNEPVEPERFVLERRMPA